MVASRVRFHIREGAILRTLFAQDGGAVAALFDSIAHSLTSGTSRH